MLIDHSSDTARVVECGGTSFLNAAAKFAVKQTEAPRRISARQPRVATPGRVYDGFLAGRGFLGFGFSAGFRAGAFGSLNVSMYGSLIKLSAVPENSITSPAFTVAVTGSS